MQSRNTMLQSYRIRDIVYVWYPGYTRIAYILYMDIGSKGMSRTMKNECLTPDGNLAIYRLSTVLSGDSVSSIPLSAKYVRKHCPCLDQLLHVNELLQPPGALPGDRLSQPSDVRQRAVIEYSVGSLLFFISTEEP